MSTRSYFAGDLIPHRPEPNSISTASPAQSPPVGSASGSVRRPSRCWMMIFLAFATLTSVSALAQGALTNGGNHDGGISTGGEKDVWTITANPGDRISVQIAELTGGASFTPRIELFAADGATLGVDSGGSAARRDVQAHVAGTFTLLVSDLNSTGAGTYRLFLAQVPGTFTVPAGDEGGPMENGQNHPGTIDPGDLDLWTFTADAGDHITVQIAEVSGGASFAPQIELVAPYGSRLGISTDGTAARLDAQAHVAGTFTVLVSDANESGSGTYTLRLARVPSAFVLPVGDNGGALTSGMNHDGTIDVGDLDLWTFTANAGDRVAVQIGELTGGPGFTPMLELFGPNGARLGVDSDGLAARLDAQAAVGGVYTVQVSDFARTGSGTYRLQLAQIPGVFAVPPGDEGGASTNEVDYNGTITLGDLDLWTFAAAAGDLITVQITELTGGASFTPLIELFGPDGQRKAFVQGGSGATLESAIDAGGTYTVLASDATQTGTGTYRLRFTRGAIAPGGANVLVNGATHLGTIASAGETNTWTFTASAGENITVRMGELVAGSTLTPALWLYGPSGVLLDYYGSSAVASEVSFRATNSGTFRAVAGSASPAGTGGYRLSLAKTGSPLVISANEEGGALTNGVMHIGTIEVGDLDAWSFTARSGDSIVLRMGELVSGSPLTPALWVYGPDGALQGAYGSSPAASEVSFRATNSGTFTVVASDFTAFYQGSGNYRLTLIKSGSPIVVSPVDESGPMTGAGDYDGTIDVGDVDAWTFTACEGDVISLSVTELVSGSALTPQLRLYGRDGVLLRTLSGAATVQLNNFLAPADGTYTVVASDLSAAYAGSGTYRLTVNGLSDALKLCMPLVSGANIHLFGIGGLPGASYVLFTALDVTTPRAQWTPILTNQFDPFGVTAITNVFNPGEPHRFFILRTP